MNRIQSESFERVLKDKYGMEWDIVGKDGLNNYIYGYTKNWKNEISEHELIGIMVSELMMKRFSVMGLSKEYKYCVASTNNVESDRVFNSSLYEALRKAVEAIEW